MTDCPLTPACDANLCDECGDAIDVGAPTCTVHNRCNNHPVHSTGCPECWAIARDAWRDDAEIRRDEVARDR